MSGQTLLGTYNQPKAGQGTSCSRSILFLHFILEFEKLSSVYYIFHTLRCRHTYLDFVLKLMDQQGETNEGRTFENYRLWVEYLLGYMT